MKSLYNKFHFGKIGAAYLKDENDSVELMIYPVNMEQNIVWDKPGNTHSLVQLMIDGDATSFGYAAGHTYVNSQSANELKCVDQKVDKGTDIKDVTTVTTTLKNDRGIQILHILTYKEGTKAIKVSTKIKNDGNEDMPILMLSSFSLGMITPFDEKAEVGQLKLYRVRSKWSCEGWVECLNAEDIQLVPSWANHGISVEKYGQVGSMPVRKFFPFAAVEDKKNNVTWAAQLATGSSWQMELFRKDENLCLSGGIADFDFGHFMKTLKPGEEFSTPEAYLTVSTNGFDSACQDLLSLHKKSDLFNGDNKCLPVVFNEYCTTWGMPSHENIEGIVNKIKDRDFDYFMIDAGWYADKKVGWQNNMGDWEISDELFPYGLHKTTELITNAGMKPGIWFEFEVVGKLAKVLKETDHLLKRHGKVIVSGDRYFLDMRDDWTKKYLKKKVTDFLNEYGFKYIKIDYNESIGIGCDGAESLGLGLYENILATQEFFRSLKEDVPELCIELCSSGGHRLEPSFLNITDMASFSDAHEEVEIPVIAGALHRMMLPEKSQIWSVIRETDSPERIVYSVAATFLGVLCISGDVVNLSVDKWELIDKGIAFYRKIDKLIRNGSTEFYGTKQDCFRHLKGWQGILRKAEGNPCSCVILHAFEENQNISIPIDSNVKIEDIYEAKSHDISIKDGILNVRFDKAYDAAAVLLKKDIAPDMLHKNIFENV